MAAKGVGKAKDLYRADDVWASWPAADKFTNKAGQRFVVRRAGRAGKPKMEPLDVLVARWNSQAVARRARRRSPRRKSPLG